MRQTRNKHKYQGRKLYFTPTPKVTGVLFGFALIAYSSVLGVKQLTHNTDLFTLEEIKISGLQYLDEDAVRQYAQIEFNKPLYDIKIEEVANNFLKNHYVRAVSVSRNIPSSLLIDIQERQPVMFLLDGSIYMVDETGIILKTLPGMPTEGLPIATGMAVNQLLQDRRPLYRALEIIAMIKEVDSSLLSFISETHLQRDHWPVLFLNQGGAKVFLGDSSHFEKIYLWSELFQQSSILDNLDQIKKIDFTFSDRILIERKS